jgi:hypothetical protein
MLGRRLIGHLAGLGFARMAKGGRRVYFANAAYQQDFNRENGFQ